MKTNLLKSIFISLILLMGVSNMSSAETITSDGTARLYLNMSAINWWIAGNMEIRDSEVYPEED